MLGWRTTILWWLLLEAASGATRLLLLWRRLLLLLNLLLKLPDGFFERAGLSEHTLHFLVLCSGLRKLLLVLTVHMLRKLSVLSLQCMVPLHDFFPDRSRYCFVTVKLILAPRGQS